MYLDVEGLVTTGMGNLIDPISLATPLPWLDVTGAPAGQAAITAEWTNIKNTVALAHQGAQAARAIATLHLDDPTIDGLILDRLTKNEAILVSYPPFADFPNWPADAQLGLLSMAWAMGPGFGPGFPRFSQACLAGDFASAAVDCAMNDAGNPGLTRRNAANRQALLYAAQVVATGADPGVLLSPVPPP